jgi:hypothetical protein
MAIDLEVIDLDAEEGAPSVTHRPMPNRAEALAKSTANPIAPNQAEALARSAANPIVRD